MGINFPNAPAVGELHPTPPQAGVPQYRWDGVAWVAQSQDQLAFVKRTGDTMSGALTLPADPAAALQAATKQYVDAKSSLYISDNPPVSPPDGSMWWDSDNGLLYIRYNDGAGPSQWVQAVATPAIDSSVFVNKAGDTMGGALTLNADPAAALQAAPKQYVDAVRAYAAPYDAIAYSGMQINGSMEVSQELGTAGVVVTTPGTKYGVDGWALGHGSSTGSSAIAQSTSSPGRGFPNSVAIYGTATPPSNAGNDYQFLLQSIEGYRWSRLGYGAANAQPVTISFWILTNFVGGGTCTLALRNGPVGNRSYVTKLTLAGSNVWEYKTVTIPGDVGGTWVTNNTVAAQLSFCGLSAASSTLNTATVNAWQAGNFIAATGQTNFMTGNGAGIFVTGVSIIPGTQAPTAAQSPLIMRPYDQELQTCKRYWESVLGGFRTTLTAQGHFGTYVDFKVEKRANPSCTSATGSSVLAVGVPNFQAITSKGASVFFTNGGSAEAYNYEFVVFADARL